MNRGFCVVDRRRSTQFSPQGVTADSARRGGGLCFVGGGCVGVFCNSTLHFFSFYPLLCCLSFSFYVSSSNLSPGSHPSLRLLADGMAEALLGNCHLALDGLVALAERSCSRVVSRGFGFLPRPAAPCWWPEGCLRVSR